MYSRISLLFLFILSCFTVRAQKGSIEGLITDAETQTPLNGATVNIPGNKGDNTDLFGRFAIPAVNPGSYEVIISHIGYKTEIIPVEVKASLLSTIAVSLKRAGVDLSEVRLDARSSSSANMISAVDIRLRPVNSSQDVLRIVPGLFIAQHAGGGKAEQIFLRGYDIDHGTDIAVTVDGIPVNMVSHAHGQGYADLHFLIPETVEKAGFEKGPYFANKGNLATAAYVDFTTKEFLDHSSVKLEAGQFNTRRATALLRVLNRNTESKRRQFYVASEYAATDGWFDSPQDFHRFNIMGKYSAWSGNQSRLTVTASTFDSKWNASGQIPLRAVQQGRIGRYGAIDDTEGGNTARTNVNIRYSHQWKNNWKSSHQWYYSRYHFNLFSNFTFFLEDPINGDMINQREDRHLFGYTGSAGKTWLLGNKKIQSEWGWGFRQDIINDLSLAKATRTRFFHYLQQGDVRENNSFAWLNQDIELGPGLSLQTGLRFDHFIFRYKNELTGSGGFDRQQKTILSPKLNISYAPNPRVKLYLNNGIGFHSNDARVIPDNQARDILPRVFGTDAGILFKPGKRLVVKATLWHLYAEQEFVYVGDAGIVEPGGKTRRLGADLAARWQPASWLFGDIDVNLTRARAIEEAKGEDYVPLAPSFTSIGGITIKAKKGFSGSLRYRLIGRRPADETNTIQASGYMLADALVSYKTGRFEFTLSGENLLNTYWREAQFSTLSRLKDEAQPVEEIHYTPGSPRFLKASVTVQF